MMWLFTQVFFLCLVSFLAGSGITAAALLLRHRVPVPAREERELRIEEMT